MLTVLLLTREVWRGTRGRVLQQEEPFLTNLHHKHYDLLLSPWWQQQIRHHGVMFWSYGCTFTFEETDLAWTFKHKPDHNHNSHLSYYYFHSYYYYCYCCGGGGGYYYLSVLFLMLSSKPNSLYVANLGPYTFMPVAWLSVFPRELLLQLQIRLWNWQPMCCHPVAMTPCY